MEYLASNRQGYGNSFKYVKVTKDLKTLSNAEYKLYTIDGKELKGKFSYDANNVVTFTYDDDFFNSYDTFFSILPPIYQNLINETKNLNKDDFINCLREKNINYYYSSSVNNQYGYSYTEYNDFGFELEIPMVIKEVKAPLGYKKSDLYSGFQMNIAWFYNKNTNNLDAIALSFNGATGHVFPVVTKLTNEFDYNSFSSFNRSVYNPYDDEFAITRECDGIIAAGSTSEFSDGYCYNLINYFQDEEGTVKLNISNTVNNLTKFNASNNKNLEYKIYVKNTGDAPSGNNVITTNVPDKVTVDESSISDAGVYNKIENTITWNIERIDDEEQIVVSYKALAPDTASGEELIGNSMVLSAQQTIETYSNNTIVTLDKIVEIINNPNTGISMIYIPNTNVGMPISVLFVITIVMSLTGVVMINKIKKKKYILK